MKHKCRLHKRHFPCENRALGSSETTSGQTSNQLDINYLNDTWGARGRSKCHWNLKADSWNPLGENTKNYIESRQLWVCYLLQDILTMIDQLPRQSDQLGQRILSLSSLVAFAWSRGLSWRICFFPRIYP